MVKMFIVLNHFFFKITKYLWAKFSHLKALQVFKIKDIDVFYDDVSPKFLVTLKNRQRRCETTWLEEIDVVYILW